MITLDQIAELRKSSELMNEILTLAERQLRQEANTDGSEIASRAWRRAYNLVTAISPHEWNRVAKALNASSDTMWAIGADVQKIADFVKEQSNVKQ